LEFINVARAIRRHWIVASIAFLVVMALGVLAAYSPADKYRASAVVLVEPDPEKPALQLQVVELITRPMVGLIETRTFRDEAKAKLPDDVAGAKVDVSAVDDGTGFLRIVASSVRREVVADWATAYAQQLVDSKPGEGYVLVSLLDTAITPNDPYAPAREPIVVSAVFLGLIVAVLAAIAAAAFRRRLDDADEIHQRFGTSVLGEIPAVRGLGDQPLAALLGPQAEPELVEAVQAMRTNVEYVLAGRPHRSIAVVSAASGEGKSTVSSVLAWSMASAGTRTSLIDADLRRPRLHHYLGLVATPGLASLVFQRKVEALLQRTRLPLLSFLAAGVPDRHPAEILPLTIPGVLEDLADTTVIIDCPPFDGFAETATLASMVEGVILVIDWRRRDLVDVERSLAALEQRGAEMLGVVINRSKRKASAASSYYSAPLLQSVEAPGASGVRVAGPNVAPPRSSGSSLP
jgi:succinoglycan biosynthesis transport protein ExoP